MPLNTRTIKTFLETPLEDFQQHGLLQVYRRISTSFTREARDAFNHMGGFSEEKPPATFLEGMMIYSQALRSLVDMEVALKQEVEILPSYQKAEADETIRKKIQDDVRAFHSGLEDILQTRTATEMNARIGHMHREAQEQGEVGMLGFKSFCVLWLASMESYIITAGTKTEPHAHDVMLANSSLQRLPAMMRNISQYWLTPAFLEASDTAHDIVEDIDNIKGLGQVRRLQQNQNAANTYRDFYTTLIDFTQAVTDRVRELKGPQRG